MLWVMPLVWLPKILMGAIFRKPSMYRLDLQYDTTKEQIKEVAKYKEKVKKVQ